MQQEDSPPVHTRGRGTYVLLSGRIALLLLAFGEQFLVASALLGQVKSIQGSLGGQYESQNYRYTEADNNVTRYRQLANLGISGHLYHNNIAEWNLQTKFINTNATSTSQGASGDQHDIYFTYYDLRADFLRATKVPVSVFLKRDVSSSEASSEAMPTLTNKILTNGYGFRVSPSLNGGSPNVGFTYDHYQSKSLTSRIPLDQANKNMQLSVDMSMGKKSNAALELVQRDRQDNFSHTDYRTREIRFRGFSQPDDSNQVSLNANYFNESRINSLNGNVLWNSQLSADLNNQTTGQVRWFQAPASNSIEGLVRDQLDIAFSPEWRGLFMLSHSEGRSTSAVVRSPLKSTSASAGASYQKSLDRYQVNLSSQTTYSQSRSLTSFKSIEGIFSGAVRTNGFSIGQISLAEQVNIRRWFASSSQTILQNSLSTTFESNAIPFVFLHSNTTYLFTRELSDIPFPTREKNLSSFFDVTYRWSNGINILATVHYGGNWVWATTSTRIVHNYAAIVQIPGLITDMNLQGRIGKTYDQLLRTHEFTYDADLTYNWRAVAVTVRWSGYSFSQWRRNDVFVTITRPFRFDFE